jgi:hypothetical protein
MPKPPEAPFIKALEQEVETYQAQVRLFSESLNVHKLDRDAIRENVRTAREALKRCKDAFDAKSAEVKPLRDALQTVSQASRKLREEFADLEARSESELDTKLSALKNRIEHESIPLNEEKKIIATIKKLEAQRSRVKEFQATVGAAAKGRADVDNLRAELKEHEAELSVLRKERDTQQAILTKFREQEAEADSEVEATMTERRRVKDLQDAAYTRMNEARKSQRTKNDAHFTNRRLSRTVRELIAAGKAEEARAMCAEQMEEMHAKLASNDQFRAQYYAQWEGVKKMRAEAEGEENNIDEDVKQGRGSKGSDDKKANTSSSRSGPTETVVQPAVKAQAVIAAALEAAATAAVEKAGAVVQEAPVVVSAHHSKNVSVEDVSYSAGALGAAGAKAKKPKHQPKYSAEPVVVLEDTFTLPEAILKKDAEARTAAERTKEDERERNRQLQAEAEARKQKREMEKAKRKKAKAEQFEKEKEALMKAKAEAAVRGAHTANEVSKKAAAEAAQRAAASEAAARQKAEQGKEETDEDDDDFGTPVLVGPRKLTQVLKAGSARPVAKRPGRNWQRGSHGVFQQILNALQDLSDSENAIRVAVISLLLIFTLNALMRE